MQFGLFAMRGYACLQLLLLLPEVIHGVKLGSHQFRRNSQNTATRGGGDELETKQRSFQDLVLLVWCQDSHVKRSSSFSSLNPFGFHFKWLQLKACQYYWWVELELWKAFSQKKQTFAIQIMQLLECRLFSFCFSQTRMKIRNCILVFLDMLLLNH